MARPLGTALSAIPGAGPVLGPGASAAMSLVADLIRAGDDAAVIITRIRHSPELLSRARAEARWAEDIDQRWDDDTDVVPRHDTLPSAVAPTEDDG
ncbi:MAG: hypothetical protein GVY18_13690 [Bacteroidetes bacterium]|nr:hypothetical protein [Bacteroidota bacterium]